MFVLLTLLVKFVIALHASYSIRCTSKGDLSEICHETTSAKAALKKKTKVTSGVVLVFKPLFKFASSACIFHLLKLEGYLLLLYYISNRKPLQSGLVCVGCTAESEASLCVMV